MRLLHQLRGHLPVWPVDPLPQQGSVLIEIYTALAAMEAGRPPSRSKMRTLEEVNEALMQLGSQPVSVSNAPQDDNQADALVTAAWLRRAAHRPELWRPQGLTDAIAATEGWTFGANWRNSARTPA